MRRAALLGRGLFLGLLLLWAGLAAVPPAADADEPPGAIDDKERSKRYGKLRSAAGRYITHRKRFPSRCPLCQGRGKRMGRVGRRPAMVTCPQCDGRGAWVSKKDYRKVYYDMRTPAFRALPGIKDTLGKQYKAATSGRPWPSLIKRYRIREREMVDDTHGIVWFLYNASTVPAATYWIWAPTSKGGSSAWFLYDARADGPWPAGEADAAPVAPGGAPLPAWEALTPAEGRALRGAVTRARLTFRVYEAARRGGALRLRLKPWADPEGRTPAQRVGTDAVRLVRSIFAGTTTWERIEAEWRAPWRDAFGRIDMRPTWRTRLTRGAHDAVPWNTRSLAQQIGILAWEQVPNAGWTPTEGAEAAPEPTPAEPTPPEPPPPADAPPDPTPAPGEPDEPRPPPEAAPPEPPAPAPPPTAPESFDLPAPDAKAERAARAGLAHMREIFALAKGAHDEGVMAHREGAHDLWQEKLSEARAHLGEIEDIWLREVVEPMPGRDEIEKDAVANEHYGEIWDEVDRLKAMVRKMSAIK